MAYRLEKLSVPVGSNTKSEKIRLPHAQEVKNFLITTKTQAVEFLANSANSLGRRIKDIQEPATAYYNRLCSLATKGDFGSFKSLTFNGETMVFVTDTGTHQLSTDVALQETGLFWMNMAQAATRKAAILEISRFGLNEQVERLMQNLTTLRLGADLPVRITRTKTNSYDVEILTGKGRSVKITLGQALLGLGIAFGALGVVIANAYNDGGGGGNQPPITPHFSTDIDRGNPQPTVVPTVHPKPTEIKNYPPTATPVFAQSIAPFYQCNASLNLAAEEIKMGQSSRVPQALMRDGESLPLDHISPAGEIIRENLNVAVNRLYTGINHRFYCLPTFEGDTARYVLHIDVERPGTYEILYLSQDGTQLTNVFSDKITGSTHLDQSKIAATPFMVGKLKDGMPLLGTGLNLITYFDSTTKNIVAAFNTDTNQFLTGEQLAGVLPQMQDLKFAVDVPLSMRDQIGKDAKIDHFDYVLSDNGKQLVLTVTIKDENGGRVVRLISDQEWTRAQENQQTLAAQKAIIQAAKDNGLETQGDLTVEKNFAFGKSVDGKSTVLITLEAGKFVSAQRIVLPEKIRIISFNTATNLLTVEYNGETAYYNFKAGKIVKDGNILWVEPKPIMVGDKNVNVISQDPNIRIGEQTTLSLAEKVGENQWSYTKPENVWVQVRSVLIKNNNVFVTVFDGENEYRVRLTANTAFATKVNNSWIKFGNVDVTSLEYLQIGRIIGVSKLYKDPNVVDGVIFFP